MKYEWKKQEKALYLPKPEPQIISVPKQRFFAIKGKGNPNEAGFAERIGVLYSLVYAVRMMPKTGFSPDGFFEYTVYPLEGVWEGTDATDKNSFRYTIMIRQPEFVTHEVAARALENTQRKKPHPLLAEAFFCEIEDGLSVQMMHIGDYDSEPASFAAMKAFMENNGLVRRSDEHREIYLSDPSKVEKDKLKTVLRYCVKEI
ncbi:MAG: GyrI-like domain-containing protein [Betaproteobacteria bacterium]|nr:GyrI-like domain-containing protein [Betaproteobacteria bacterium]